MASIKFELALVYFAPTKGRRYLTKRAAANAEARAMLESKYASEEAEFDDEGRMTYPGFHWSNEDRLKRVHERLTRLILRQFKASQGEQT